jgi:hypothetical protein
VFCERVEVSERVAPVPHKSLRLSDILEAFVFDEYSARLYLAERLLAL